MADGWDEQGHCFDNHGTGILQKLKCQPCLEDGNLHEIVGMCADCQDYLCRKCFDIHQKPRPSRHHKLLDREQMLQSQMQATSKDKCREKCTVHKNKVIKYYCLRHSALGCSVCTTLNHKTCEKVRYIPHVATELASNKEYRTVENHLKSALDTLKKLSDVKANTELVNASFIEALGSIRAYRIKLEEALNKIEAELCEQLQAIQAQAIQECALISDRYKQAQEDLRSALTKVKALQQAGQNCSSYTEMMKTKEKLKSLEAETEEIDRYKSYRPPRIQFDPNLELLDTLKHTEALGKTSASDSGFKENLENPPTRKTASIGKSTIISAEHAQDINVKRKSDIAECWITGVGALPGGKLVLADWNNSSIKVVNVQKGQVTAHLKLSSEPWDITAISKNKVTATQPGKRKLAIFTVADDGISADRTLNVNGRCHGIDYRNGQLAVSYCNPHKVQILNLQGSVLYDISRDKLGQDLFNDPYYLTYGQKKEMLYVSNLGSHNVVCVKVDGTVVATLTDSDLSFPRKPVLDSSGDLFVCYSGSHTVQQITPDCQKVCMLLTEADDLYNLCSISFSKERDELYIGLISDFIKVFKFERGETI